MAGSCNNGLPILHYKLIQLLAIHTKKHKKKECKEMFSTWGNVHPKHKMGPHKSRFHVWGKIFLDIVCSLPPPQHHSWEKAVPLSRGMMQFCKWECFLLSSWLSYGYLKHNKTTHSANRLCESHNVWPILNSRILWEESILIMTGLVSSDVGMPVVSSGAHRASLSFTLVIKSCFLSKDHRYVWKNVCVCVCACVCW